MFNGFAICMYVDLRFVHTYMYVCSLTFKILQDFADIAALSEWEWILSKILSILEAALA